MLQYPPGYLEAMANKTKREATVRAVGSSTRGRKRGRPRSSRPSKRVQEEEDEKPEVNMEEELQSNGSPDAPEEDNTSTVTHQLCVCFCLFMHLYECVCVSVRCVRGAGGAAGEASEGSGIVCSVRTAAESDTGRRTQQEAVGRSVELPHGGTGTHDHTHAYFIN